MPVPIPTLWGTSTHATAIELYQRHHGDRYGVCVRCGQHTPCPVQVFAASVIAAAGKDPHGSDHQPAPPVRPADGPSQRADRLPAAESDGGRSCPDHYGYGVGGRRTPVIPEGLRYEREPG
jgi:hypothetical protein